MLTGALGSFVCGSCAGVSYWVSIYPLDSVKSRVQVLSAQGKVAGLWRTFWNILTTEGETMHALNYHSVLCKTADSHDTEMSQKNLIQKLTLVSFVDCSQHSSRRSARIKILRR